MRLYDFCGRAWEAQIASVPGQIIKVLEVVGQWRQL
jgi:hypothetical protein